MCRDFFIRFPYCPFEVQDCPLGHNIAIFMMVCDANLPHQTTYKNIISWNLKHKKEFIGQVQY